MIRLRGSWRRREATSSRQALSTLFRRARLRGKPLEGQVMGLGACGVGAERRTEQVDSAVPPRPSDTRTVTVIELAVTPVVSRVTFAPSPVMRPALGVHL